MTTFGDLITAREELTRLLAEAGWSYYRAMCRYSWQMNWAKDFVPLPPTIETLSLEQLRHLSALVAINIEARKSQTQEERR